MLALSVNRLRESDANKRFFDCSANGDAGEESSLTT